MGGKNHAGSDAPEIAKVILMFASVSKSDRGNIEMPGVALKRNLNRTACTVEVLSVSKILIFGGESVINW